MGEHVPKLVNGLNVACRPPVHGSHSVPTPARRQVRDTLFGISSQHQHARDPSGPWGDGAAREEIWRRSGQEIKSSYLRQRTLLEHFGALDSPVPILLFGQPQDPEYLDLQHRFAAEHDWFSVLKLDARTHFAMLEAASEVARAVEAFVSGTR